MTAAFPLTQSVMQVLHRCRNRLRTHLFSKPSTDPRKIGKAIVEVRLLYVQIQMFIYKSVLCERGSSQHATFKRSTQLSNGGVPHGKGRKTV